MPRSARRMRIPPPGQRLRNVRLVVEYDGTRFKGWQVQPNARTVAGALQKALEQVIGDPIKVVGAGRTDEGVHAEGQVANFLTRFSHPVDGLVRAVNDALPEDVAVASAADVGPQFHARHSASSRVYRYHVAKRRSPFLVRRAWLMEKRLNVAKMIEATKLVVGFHDFAAFTDKRLLGDASTKVDVTYAGWKEQPGQVIFRIAASHFLPRMVRRIVGCLVRVGTGELRVEELRRWLETGEGESGALTAPAMGLILEHVEYPAEALSVTHGDRVHPLAEAALAALDGDDSAGYAEDESDDEPGGHDAVEPASDDEETGAPEEE
jgi:tRNA pseudouridine38-40 synthase